MAQNRWGEPAPRLGQEKVHGPDWIPTPATELNKEHLAAHEFVDFLPLHLPVIATCIFGPDVRLLFNLTWDLYVRRVVRGQDPFQSHRQAVPGQDLAALCQPHQVEFSA